MSRRTGFAGAKVNLYLHVGPPGTDGYHPIDSLMVFADVGDLLTLEPAAEPAFTASGAFSGAAGQAVLTYSAASKTTTLFLDTNGDGAADFELLLNGNVSSAGGGFIL